MSGDAASVNNIPVPVTLSADPLPWMSRVSWPFCHGDPKKYSMLLLDPRRTLTTHSGDQGKHAQQPDRIKSARNRTSLGLTKTNTSSDPSQTRSWLAELVP